MEKKAISWEYEKDKTISIEDGTMYMNDAVMFLCNKIETMVLLA